MDENESKERVDVTLEAEVSDRSVYCGFGLLSCGITFKKPFFSLFCIPGGG